VCSAVGRACSPSVQNGLVGRDHVRLSFSAAGVQCQDSLLTECYSGNCGPYGAPYVHPDQADRCYYGLAVAADCAQSPVDSNHRRLCACTSTLPSLPPFPPLPPPPLPYRPPLPYPPPLPPSSPGPTVFVDYYVGSSCETFQYSATYTDGVCYSDVEWNGTAFYNPGTLYIKLEFISSTCSLWRGNELRYSTFADCSTSSSSTGWERLRGGRIGVCYSGFAVPGASWMYRAAGCAPLPYVAAAEGGGYVFIIAAAAGGAALLLLIGASILIRIKLLHRGGSSESLTPNKRLQPPSHAPAISEHRYTPNAAGSTAPGTSAAGGVTLATVPVAAPPPANPVEVGGGTMAAPAACSTSAAVPPPPYQSGAFEPVKAPLDAPPPYNPPTFTSEPSPSPVVIQGIAIAPEASASKTTEALPLV